jgi:hypothetical protein
MRKTNTPAGVREHLEQILARYEKARVREPFGTQHELWDVFKTLKQELVGLAAVQKRPTLTVSWSAGQGSWAKVPWIAFLDQRQTKTTRQGVYGAFLFRQDMTGVYLALIQGITEPRRQLGRAIARTTLRKRAADLRALCRDLPEHGFHLNDLIDLRADPALGADYEASVIAYKLYEAGDVPADETIETDLEALLRTYDRYLAGKRDRALAFTATTVREPRRGATRKPFALGPAVQALIEHIDQKRFVFEPWQIAAYVAALRTKPFVILAGVTGTGKSRLPALVAGATGGTARLVPVRPDWTDSADVLGYTDLQGTFRPGVLLELAREAMTEPDRHQVCILDEMNLARVEQYFAEVLSRIEDRQPASDGGFASGLLLHPTLHDAASWASVVLPPNLALVGTVNMDESAHGFSRKVLDRAFTLELSDVDLAAWEAHRPQTEAADLPRWPVTAWHPRAIRLGELTEISDQERERVQETIAALTAVNAFLTPAGLQAGYRTRDEMALFVLHAAEIRSSFLTRSGDPVDPLDLALGMKVLPRIIGGSGAVRRAVLGMLGWAYRGKPVHSETEVQAILDEWDTAGRPGTLPGARFPRTAARLCLMWERFLAEGFTSFWL